MTWLALLLIGVAVADLGHSVRPVRHLPESAAAVVVVAVAGCAGLLHGRDLVATIVIGLVVLGWGVSVRHGFARDRAWLPLTLLGGAVVLALGLSPLAGGGGGVLDDWLRQGGVGALDGYDVGQALLLLGVLLVQMSTGNVVVRLVLRATGTVDPARGAGHDVARTLKGGRLLGPMERLFIVGLGVAGHVTAASIVIAAKGLLRFPELQAKRDDAGPDIDEVTEYFLVGSFVSWMISLGSLVLLAT